MASLWRRLQLLTAGTTPARRFQPHYLKEISNNVYARARFDSIIIDAKNESSTPRNPLAVAHKINHPPAESGPNVMPFAFDFPPEDPFESPEYQRLIPNSFVEMPSRLAMFGKRALVHGLVFITTAEINDGEELFLNYSLYVSQASTSCNEMFFGPVRRQP
ncbi:hypothetical protein ATCC90586_008764 [Pythium insidiosum]|nr:hypothetical protein ATCC90586_008764 [Pythium insidiosum]